jgi:ABC-2 type transport system permease protein
MWAIVLKEFRQMRRDRRTLAMMILLPLVLLIMFGYAASFDITSVRTVIVGPGAAAVAPKLPGQLDVVSVRPAANRDDAVTDLRRGQATVAVVTAPGRHPALLVDGSELFAAKAVVAAAKAGQVPLQPEVLFNPTLKTSVVMVPGLIGIVLVFVGTLFTALGVVRERQAGTLEQLAVMPFRPRDVFVGKIAPYFAVAALDTAVIVAAGLGVFGVPFRGSVFTFVLAAVLFLFVTLGVGVLISTVSQNQGQAIQLAIMTLLPQILLSGLVFPVTSMAPGVRWIAYLLPLTYFIRISRAVLIKAAPISSLWLPLTMLAVLGAVVFTLSVLRFRRDLAPAPTRGRLDAAAAAAPVATR